MSKVATDPALEKLTWGRNGKLMTVLACDTGYGRREHSAGEDRSRLQY